MQVLQQNLCTNPRLMDVERKLHGVYAFLKHKFCCKTGLAALYKEME